MEKLKCSCGCGLGIDHDLGEDACFRTECFGDEVPKNIRIENGREVCDVGGVTRGIFDIKNHDLYYDHGSGRWSKAKDGGVNTTLDSGDRDIF